ncbi:hypothetical protein ACFFGR_18040 [Arthrobacter liuii]|uniref:Uncharacterized protein n=1 Tax=Arthrobacter liuii TaxID=1476996 RepID=A0ABQ2ATG7_9MICC|nr:hypothetical protein [Arthrobacter liuii]GGH97182.1 hypothetical protein GCM10007170_26790 [Arthrobacter liuii]
MDAAECERLPGCVGASTILCDTVLEAGRSVSIFAPFAEPAPKPRRRRFTLPDDEDPFA